jgi:hypothetical protein
MGKKIALNVFYNLGIFYVSWLYTRRIEHAQYEYLLGCGIYCRRIYLHLK